MATSITIRNVPTQARDTLALRARRSGRSLQEYLRAQIIDLARRTDPEDFIAQIRADKERSPMRISARQILAHRDAGRR